MTFIFSWLGNMLHSDTPLIIAIITEGCRIWEKSTVSHPQRFCRFFTSRQHKFWPNIFFLVHMSRHNGNYRMIALYWYVLCIGILLSWHANDVMFLGCQANFGMQKNYATGTFRILFRLNQSHKKCRKTIETLYFKKSKQNWFVWNNLICCEFANKIFLIVI